MLFFQERLNFVLSILISLDYIRLERMDGNLTNQPVFFGFLMEMAKNFRKCLSCNHMRNFIIHLFTSFGGSIKFIKGGVLMVMRSLSEPQSTTVKVVTALML